LIVIFIGQPKRILSTQLPMTKKKRKMRKKQKRVKTTRRKVMMTVMRRTKGKTMIMIMKMKRR
jgi:hypothetical protein